MSFQFAGLVLICCLTDSLTYIYEYVCYKIFFCFYSHSFGFFKAHIFETCLVNRLYNAKWSFVVFVNFTQSYYSTIGSKIKFLNFVKL